MGFGLVGGFKRYVLYAIKLSGVCVGLRVAGLDVRPQKKPEANEMLPSALKAALAKSARGQDGPGGASPLEQFLPGEQGLGPLSWDPLHEASARKQLGQ